MTDGLRSGLVDIIERLAGEVFGSDLAVSDKGDDGIDLVTSIDYALQSRLMDALPRLLPGSDVVGEEDFAGLDRSCRYVWLVDPLDGTVNFVGGLPIYAVAVALLDEGMPVVAAVHDIPRGVTFSARAGGGALRGGIPLRPRQSRARLGALSSGLIRDLARYAPDTLVELLSSWKLRNLGSQALQLCHLAEGSLKFVASYEARAWDDLAGSLIAREAGLIYGHYVPVETPAPDAPQMSLCAAAGLFEELAVRLARSVPDYAAPQ